MSKSECKISKQGWPLGKTNWEFGTIQTNCARSLCNSLEYRFGFSFYFMPMEIDDRYSVIHADDVRLSMERYNQVKYFIDGYKACLYY